MSKRLCRFDTPCNEYINSMQAFFSFPNLFFSFPLYRLICCGYEPTIYLMEIRTTKHGEGRCTVKLNR